MKKDLSSDDGTTRKYSPAQKNSINLAIECICLALIYFSLLGLIWAIPIPHFSILGKLNGYLNLATLVIIWVTISSFRTSIRIGLTIVVLIWVFSACIILLERMARLHAWPQMGLICLGLLLMALIVLYISYRSVNNSGALSRLWKKVLAGPINLLKIIFN